jgi:uncharacterized protein (TIGR03084 family)
MDEVVAALRAQQDELATYVADADEAALQRPSRCPGWTVADVLLHLAQTNELAMASTAGRFEARADEVAAGLPPGGDVDDWAGALVAAERGEPEAARDRWLASAERQADAFAACAPQARLRWVAGELAARTLATTRLAETWIHTVDVAVALGPEPVPTDRLWHIARLAWRTVPYALAGGGHVAAGPVAFELRSPGGDPWAFGTADQTGLEPLTVVRGSAHDLCTVAGQRAAAADTSLRAEGPDGAAVLRLVRTFA